MKNLVNIYRKQFNTSRIFISSNNIPVFWAHISVVDAELICLNDLLKYPGSNWKFVLNIAGTELPIMTHKAIRSQLEANKDRDIVTSYPFPYIHFERFNESHEMVRYDNYT